MKLLPPPKDPMKCVECYAGAEVVVMMATQWHVCGRACLIRAHDEYAKLSLKLEKDAS